MYLKSALLLSTLFAAPLVWAADMCVDTPSLPVDPNTQPNVSSHQDVYYQDILNRCTTMISDLERAQMRANSIARTGNLNGAAQILANALAQKVAQLPPPEYDSYNPHTAEAIRNGNTVVQKLFSVSGQVNGLPRPLVGQVRFAISSEVFRLIKMAYHELDERYYMSTVRSCYYHCDPWSQYGIPMEYYDGVRRLAKSFLELQINTARIQASDSIELPVSAEVVGAAKNILLGSVFRRDYSCAINELHELEWDIKNEICGDLGVPTNWFVDEVRNRIQNVNFELRSCRW